MGRLNRFLHLSRADQWLLIKVTLLVNMVSLGLQLLPFHTLRYWLKRAAGEGFSTNRLSEKDHSLSEALKICRAIDATGRSFLGEDSCFPQALSGELLLRRSSYNPRLCIGVKKDNNDHVKAHAWVEMDGKVVIGGPQSLVDKYTLLPDIDES